MHCWSGYVFIGIVSFLGIGHMIAACGQKGDLYLPPAEDSGNTARSAGMPTQREFPMEAGEGPYDVPDPGDEVEVPQFPGN